ncbi:lipoprotein signal peptidase [Halosquirtibacter xylanolyticus]|uniref:lipoprotein signal peptidase n=1 Tax=Halosquirtibacter xylanolyticus TaxID=3374599 RepID=UPI003747850A|nr:lipoprotein signal peptidase [Prolixibacteraceae bacterium]
MSKRNIAIVVVLLLLVIDQASKFWIKTHMMLGDEFDVFGDWFRIHFVENNGMAFGFEFAGKYGKPFLTIFRIFASAAIIVYLNKLIKKGIPTGAVVSISLILAGAIGNIIDCAFYGVIFDHSFGQIATLFPDGGGYETFFYGKVVDMLYFPLVEGNFPAWFPKVGGNHFLFFSPVFNIADSAISVGIAILLLFYRKIFDEEKEVHKA